MKAVMAVLTALWMIVVQLLTGSALQEVQQEPPFHDEVLFVRFCQKQQDVWVYQVVRRYTPDGWRIERKQYRVPGTFWDGGSEAAWKDALIRNRAAFRGSDFKDHAFGKNGLRSAPRFRPACPSP